MLASPDDHRLKPSPEQPDQNPQLGLNLANLNAERSNNPGLDLGDAADGWAFQVTADKSGAKVKETLEKIDDAQRAKYKNIRILVIGEKQGSYTFVGEPFDSFEFTADMVWDFNDVCGRVMSLPIDTLSDLAGYVSKETRRVRIELEVPDSQGNFATNIDHLIESLPKPQLSDAAKMEAHFVAKGGSIDRAEAEKAIGELSRRLAALPRLTREVFRFLVQRRDEELSRFGERFRMSVPKLRRIYRGDDLDGDLALLEEAGLIDINEPDDPPRGAYYWRLLIPGSDHGFEHQFVEYAADKKIDLGKPLVTLDFSDF